MNLFFKLWLVFLTLSIQSGYSIESSNGFLVTAFDNKFKVVSPGKFRESMEVIVENKTLVRLIGKVVVNNENKVSYVAVDPDRYQRIIIHLKKGDILHFIPLSPSFQEVELIVGNKNYEIPPER